MAECHPVGFQWVMEAKKRGATIIHVDPRFTRTSAMADVHVPIRAGTDIAFLGALPIVGGRHGDGPPDRTGPGHGVRRGDGRPAHEVRPDPPGPSLCVPDPE